MLVIVLLRFVAITELGWTLTAAGGTDVVRSMRWHDPRRRIREVRRVQERHHAGIVHHAQCGKVEIERRVTRCRQW